MFVYLDRALTAIGKKYSLQIVGILLKEQQGKGFNHFLKNIPEINPKSLSTRLKDLEAAGVLSKQLTMGVPIKIEYRLTDKGIALQQPIQSMDGWGKRYCR